MLGGLHGGCSHCHAALKFIEEGGINRSTTKNFMYWAGSTARNGTGDWAKNIPPWLPFFKEGHGRASYVPVHPAHRDEIRKGKDSLLYLQAEMNMYDVIHAFNEKNGLENRNLASEQVYDFNGRMAALLAAKDRDQIALAKKKQDDNEVAAAAAVTVTETASSASRNTNARTPNALLLRSKTAQRMQVSEGNEAEGDEAGPHKIRRVTCVCISWSTISIRESTTSLEFAAFSQYNLLACSTAMRPGDCFLLCSVDSIPNSF